MAHPHLFITNKTEIFVQKDKRVRLRFHWLFDSMFSLSLIRDHDRNRNNTFEPAEVERVRKKAFQNLRNYQYFLKIYLNNKRVYIRRIPYFSAGIEKGKQVRYSFDVSLSSPLKKGENKLRVAIYDPTRFSFLNLASGKAVSLTGLAPDHYELRSLPAGKKGVAAATILAKLMN